ncbi:PIR protein [Plasmodium yoelii]|uniref:PIR protein n=2 Tax=Plasmodium yoelii TaxID=5861 RepID=A0AAE9WK51_PLAYO|nr:PIR protein [Plasmodium yoelii]WBY55488.1 PIR protein [Plasmodium yoelii yoelii]CDS45063.1 YIR protein [Plasmodium yoelii]VTZ74010.1 PIR protein [Plasmodium yoelii]|eukprot:XP_022812315.1 PIR protein [Plasmodium yoelii]
MDKEVCKRFENVREWISDDLIDGNYQFKDDNSLNNKFSNNYCNDNINILSGFCNNNKFLSDFDRISAGCLYLLGELINDCGVDPSTAKNNINIIDYIMIWLSYMINLKYSEEDNIITCFYIAYMNDCDKYNKEINGCTGYKDYKELLDKKNDVLNMDSKIAPKFYKAFKLLCKMYTEFDENMEDCTNYSEKASQFVEKYEELYDDYNKTKDSSYKKVLCTLSTDYDNLIKKYNDAQCCKSSPLPTIETEKIPENCSEQTSEKTYGTGYEQFYGEFPEVTLSESSLVSKLFIVLSIFAAIPIFLGIAYKYSLFGFRKRFQKQKLREKLKK